MARVLTAIVTSCVLYFGLTYGVMLLTMVGMSRIGVTSLGLGWVFGLLWLISFSIAYYFFIAPFRSNADGTRPRGNDARE